MRTWGSSRRILSLKRSVDVDWLTGPRELSFSLGSSRILYSRARRAFSLSTISDDIRARRTRRIESLVGVLHKADAGLVRTLDGVVGNTSSLRVEIP